MNGKANTWRKLLAQRGGVHFINREREQELFRLNFLYDIPAYLIFAIHGPDGIGKSALLARYRTIAQEHDAVSVSVDAASAMVTRDQTILHVMVEMARQFAPLGIRFSVFQERYDEYLACMQMLAEDFNAPGGMYDLLSSVADVQTMRGEAWDKYLFERFGNPTKISLVKMPVEALTQIFVKDMNAWATIRPMLLCFDDWDRIGPHLEDWLQGLLTHYDMRTNIWIAIASQHAIDDDAWDAFRPVMASFDLHPFTEAEIHAYAGAHNVTDPARVTDIATFSGGLPVLVNLLARARGGSADDLALTPVDRFLKWVDDPRWRDVVLACAVARRLDTDVVATLVAEPDADAVCAWLEEAGILVQQTDHWRYHPTLRARLLAYAQQQTPGIIHNAHAQLLAHYRRRSFVDGEFLYRNDHWRADKLEALYHGLMIADPLAIQEGVEIFLRALRNYFPLSGEIVATWQQAAAAQLTRNAVVEWSDSLQTLWHALERRDWEEVFAVCETLAARVDDYSEATRYALQVLRDVAQARLPRPAPATETVMVSDVESEALPPEPEVVPEPEEVQHEEPVTTPAVEQPEPIAADEPVVGEPASTEDIEGKTVPVSPVDMKETPIKESDVSFTPEPAELDAPLPEAPVDTALPLEEPTEPAAIPVSESDLDTTVAGYTRRADVYLSMGEYERAIQEYGKAIDLDPAYERAHYNRGLAYAQQQKYPEAIADLTRAIDLNPEHATVYYNRGLVRAWQNDLVQAIADYDQAIARNPADATIYNSRANAYYKIKDYQRAIADYDQAVKYAPDYADAYLNRGLAYATIEEYQQAIADYNQAVALNPESAVAYNNRGLAYARLQQYARAMEDYTLALTLDPRYAVAYNNLGLCYVRLDNLAQAIVEYQRAAKVAPQYATAHYNAACAAALMGDADVACTWLEKAIQLAPRYQTMAQRDTDFDPIRDDSMFQALVTGEMTGG